MTVNSHPNLCQGKGMEILMYGPMPNPYYEVAAASTVTPQLASEVTAKLSGGVQGRVTAVLTEC